jgi:hypothetical protein
MRTRIVAATLGLAVAAGCGGGQTPSTRSPESTVNARTPATTGDPGATSPVANDTSLRFVELIESYESSRTVRWNVSFPSTIDEVLLIVDVPERVNVSFSNALMPPLTPTDEQLEPPASPTCQRADDKSYECLLTGLQSLRGGITTDMTVSLPAGMQFPKGDTTEEDWTVTAIANSARRGRIPQFQLEADSFPSNNSQLVIAGTPD